MLKAFGQNALKKGRAGYN